MCASPSGRHFDLDFKVFGNLLAATHRLHRLNAIVTQNDINCPTTKLPTAHEMSFRHDIRGQYQITPLRTLSPMAETSSDTEVVGNLLVRAFDGEHGDEIPLHSVNTAKSVLNLYLHAQFCMILPFRNHIRTVANRGKHKPQISRWVI